MTEWYDFYKGFYDALAAVVATADSVKQVYCGKAPAINKFPFAQINPLEAAVDTDIGGDKSTVTFRFEVILVATNTEPDDWFPDVVEPMSDIVKVIWATPRLGGAALDTALLKFSPGAIDLKGGVYYGGRIEYEALAIWS